MNAQKQDWGARFEYSPPLVAIYIPDSQIIAIEKTQQPERSTVADWVKVTVVSGQEFIVTGKISDYDRGNS